MSVPNGRVLKSNFLGVPIHLVETENLTPTAFPLWADRLSATLSAGDAAMRLEAMLHDLNVAADSIRQIPATK